MKAIIFTQYGSPENLELAEVPKPSPQDHEVLIQVCASSINSWDWEFLNGIPLINRLLYGLFRPKKTKQILGADIAGIVEAVGRNVSRFRVGDEVFGDRWDNWGGFSEYVCAPETALESKPQNLSYVEAATVPQAGVLALQGLHKGGPVQSGQKILINGAGGGVGTFAIQLAKLSGAEVTGVDATHKLEIMRAVGADHTLDFTQVDFTQIGEQYDHIIDCQNFRSMSKNLRALKDEGTYAMIGGAIPLVYQLWLFSLVGPLLGMKKQLHLVAEGPNKGLAELKALLEAGLLVPVIDRTYPLSDVPEALRYFGMGEHKGKIAIAINP